MIDNLFDSSSPWMCLVEPLQGVLEAARRIGPVSYSAARRTYPVVDGTGILSVAGVLMKDASWYAPTSYSDLRRELGQMKTDPQVARVLVHIDSGGGQSRGLMDLVSELQAVGKPTWSYIEDVGASAAYAIAAATDKIYANRTALVGSIGTYSVVVDSSKGAQKLGLKVHVIRAGQFKGAGVPGTEISEEHLADVQRIVNAVNEQFIETVMRGRHMGRSQVEAIADGRVHIGQEAQQLGLIDGVRSLDSVFREFAKVGSAARPDGVRAAVDPPPLTEADMVQLFEAALKHYAASGMDRLTAAAKAQRKYPEWHQAYTRRHNPAAV